MTEEIIRRFGERVGYSDLEMDMFKEGGHRIRQIERLAQAAPLYAIEAEIVKARHCNSGYRKGDRFLLDVDGNMIAKLCPRRLCVYLVSQFAIPVALINERLSEGLDPNNFHFMRYVGCPDVGVDCLGYGEVLARFQVIRRCN